MKKLIFISLLFLSIRINAQKYALLDTRISHPVTFANEVTTSDKMNGLFPVEKKELRRFVGALEEINKQLLTTGPMGEAKQYKIGCTTFKGLVVPAADNERLDYVITSSCDNVAISMHLSNAKRSNRSNAYFIKTWIKYIERAMK